MLTSLLLPGLLRADGCFVAPPFVWNKHKDINEPTQKAILVYEAGREDLILQVKYDGPVEQFGWLVPVPGLPTVQKGSMESFYALSRYTQENWEPRLYPDGNGQGIEDNATPALSAGAPSPEPVKVVEINTVGAYEVAVLSAREPGSLEKWLAANGFAFPQDKAEVIDSYVKQHWYFVAVKIDLRQAGGFRLAGAPRQARKIAAANVTEKLAEGELQPLQVSFDTERCVFPLKISSVNGTPSEVQVYVLSPQPLVERRMFEKKFPELKRLALQENTNRVRSRLESQALRRAMMLRFNPARGLMPLPPMETNLPMNVILRRGVPADQLLHYGAVTEKDVPDARLPRFPGKTWWLTKQTWTFQPDEMEDLFFDPAADVFGEDLGDELGYYVAQNLTRLGANAVPVLLPALQSTNPMVRIHAASAFDENDVGQPLAQDARVIEYLPILFNDPEPEVRADAAEAAGEAWSPEFARPLIHLLRDGDEGVQSAAVFALERNPGGPEQVSALLALLKDDNLKVRANALEILSRSGEAIPRADVLPLLGVPDIRVLGLAVQDLERDGVSNDDLLPLLHSPYMPARLLWLRVMRAYNDRTVMENIIALLRDPEPAVRGQAWELLQFLTGQTLPEDQPDQWAQWWTANKLPALIDEYNKILAENPADGESYRIRGCYNYDAHDFTKALADFRQSIRLGCDTPEYSHYRVWLARARTGEAEAATGELAAYLQTRATGKPNDWPAKVGQFLAGQLAEGAFLNAATNPDPQTDREQHCEAWFYAGSKRLIAGDKTTAAADFQKCLDTGVKNFEEYESAGAELKLLK